MEGFLGIENSEKREKPASREVDTHHAGGSKRAESGQDGQNHSLEGETFLGKERSMNRPFLEEGRGPQKQLEKWRGRSSKYGGGNEKDSQRNAKRQ